MVTVGDMREIAESILEQLDGYEDDCKVHTRCNTYGMDSTIIEVQSWRDDGGFIDYTDIIIEDDDEDEEEAE